MIYYKTVIYCHLSLPKQSRLLYPQNGLDCMQMNNHITPIIKVKDRLDIVSRFLSDLECDSREIDLLNFQKKLVHLLCSYPCF